MPPAAMPIIFWRLRSGFAATARSWASVPRIEASPAGVVSRPPDDRGRKFVIFMFVDSSPWILHGACQVGAPRNTLIFLVIPEGSWPLEVSADSVRTRDRTRSAGLEVTRFLRGILEVVVAAVDADDGHGYQFGRIDVVQAGDIDRIVKSMSASKRTVPQWQLPLWDFFMASAPRIRPARGPCCR